MYNSSNSLISQDIITLLNQCNTLWILFGSIMITFAMIMIISRKFMSHTESYVRHSNPDIDEKTYIKPTDTIWETVTYWLDQDCSNAQYNYDQIISLSMSIFLFFGMAWLINNMSTDLMVATDVSTIETYKDVLDAGRPVMLTATPEWNDFKYAPKDSFKRKIFGLVQKQGEHGSFGMNTTLTIAQNNMKSAISDYSHRSMILNKGCALLIRRYFCSNFLNFDQYRSLKSLLRHDKNARRTSQAIIMNKNTAPSRYIAVILRM